MYRMNKKQSMAMATCLLLTVIGVAVAAQHFARMSNVEQTSVQVVPALPLLYTIDAVDLQIDAGLYNANFLNCTVLSLYETCYVIPWILISCEDGILVSDVNLFLWFSYAGNSGTEGNIVLNQINSTAIEGGILRAHDSCRLLTGESLILRYSIEIIPLGFDDVFDIFLWAEDDGV